MPRVIVADSFAFRPVEPAQPYFEDSVRTAAQSAAYYNDGNGKEHWLHAVADAPTLMEPDGIWWS